MTAAIFYNTPQTACGVDTDKLLPIAIPVIPAKAGMTATRTVRALGRGRFFRWRGRHSELGIVHRDVLLNLVYLDSEAPAGPRDGPAVGNLGAVGVTIIGKIRLGRNAAQWRLNVSDHANQQAGLLVEVKPDRRLTLLQPKD